MHDGRRWTQRRAADREGRERYLFHNVLIGELARLADALHAEMSSRRRDEPGDDPARAASEAADQVAAAAERLAEMGTSGSPRIPDYQPVPPGIRRAAGRRAIPRHPPAPGSKLREAARVGLLTRANTRGGTRGRQAALAEEYAHRQATGRRRGATTAREAAGHHAQPEPAAMSAILVDAGFTVLDSPSRRERSRIARWNSLAGQLVDGEMTSSEFRRRIRTWRPIRDDRFESNPELVLAILDARRIAGDSVFIYEGRRS